MTINNTNIIKLLYGMGQLTLDEIFAYVCNGKITQADYTTITTQECPALSLEVAKKLKKDEISLKCKDVIYGGFVSNAHYAIDTSFGSTMEDQANITGNANAAISKIAGVSECQADVFYYHASGMGFEEWTANECITLGRHFKAFKESNLMKSKLLQDHIDSLTDPSIVLTITWDTEVI